MLTCSYLYLHFVQLHFLCKIRVPQIGHRTVRTHYLLNRYWCRLTTTTTARAARVLLIDMISIVDFLLRWPASPYNGRVSQGYKGNKVDNARKVEHFPSFFRVFSSWYIDFTLTGFCATRIKSVKGASKYDVRKIFRLFDLLPLSAFTGCPQVHYNFDTPLFSDIC